MPDVAEPQNTVAYRLERNIVHFGDIRQLAVAVDVVVARANANVSGRENLVRIVHGAHHVHRTQLCRLELYRIDIKLDLTILAAKRLRNGCSGNVRNLVANGELSFVVQLRFVQALSFERNKAHGKTRCVELQHHRRQRTLRQSTQVGHGKVRDFADRRVWIGSRLEVHLD